MTEGCIKKILEVSTAHITRKTDMWLAEGPDGVVAYPKEDYGWVIMVAPCEADIPDDLRQLIDYARACGCDWIMLDCDAPEIKDLPVYDWASEW